MKIRKTPRTDIPIALATPKGERVIVGRKLNGNVGATGEKIVGIRGGYTRERNEEEEMIVVS